MEGNPEPSQNHRESPEATYMQRRGSPPPSKSIQPVFTKEVETHPPNAMVEQAEAEGKEANNFRKMMD